MNFKLLVLSFILFSVIFAFPQASRGISSQSLGAGKMTYVVAANAGGPQTVDPALAYDTASGELIQNVYDTLVFFNGTSANQFVPWLASSYRISPDGQTYNFTIRTGVQWQDPTYSIVTPADVEYSLKKVLVRDYNDGPAWMLWFSIFGLYSAANFGNLSNPAVATALGNLIDNAITSNATGVTIQFQTGKPYPQFLGILANTWGSIQSKQWCIDNGDWNPDVDRLIDGSWVNAHDPAVSPLDSPFKMMGSGPFEFNYLNIAVAWSIIRNGGQGSANYEIADLTPTTIFWGGWGTSRTSLLGMATISRGYLDEIVEYFISEYATRLAGFTGPAPIYDSIAVPRSQVSTVWQQPGIKCQYPLTELVANAVFFNYDVGLTSPLIGAPTGYGYFGELGITPDFFSDVHARKAMAYSFNWTQHISSIYLGEGKQNAIPVPESFKFFDGSLPKYEINITRATEEWKLAWGGNSTSPGSAWTQGFRFTILYNPAVPYQSAAAAILKANVETQNPKFHIDIGPEHPGGPYYTYVPYSQRPVFTSAWLADYPDIHDFVEPFIASWGYYGSAQHIGNDPSSPEMDKLITWGANNATDVGRNANYQRLWQLYIQQVPSVPLEQPWGRRWARDWVHGWYYNSIFLGVYNYSLWKEDIQTTYGPFAGKLANWEDVTEDGKVDIKDLAIAAKGFGQYFIQPVLPPYPPGQPWYSPNWNSRVDMNIVDVVTGGRGDMKIDIRDLAQMAKLYGFLAPAWQPGP